MELKNYQYIDSLRGVAIMMVMATHCQLFGTNNYSPAVKELLNHGTLGVQLFLVAVFIQLIAKTIFPYHFVFAVLMGGGVYLLSLYPTELIVNKFTVFIGKISFSLYVSHFAVLKLMASLNLVDFVNLPLLNYSIRYLILLIISSAVSLVTYRLVELPGIELGKKIIKTLSLRWTSGGFPLQKGN